MVVSTYQAASGAGAAAMEELELQTREVSSFFFFVFLFFPQFCSHYLFVSCGFNCSFICHLSLYFNGHLLHEEHYRFIFVNAYFSVSPRSWRVNHQLAISLTNSMLLICSRIMHLFSQTGTMKRK